MKFLTEKDYTDFVELVKANDDGTGKMPMAVYVTNLNEMDVSNFYLDFKAGVSRNREDEKVYKKFACTIKEY